MRACFFSGASKRFLAASLLLGAATGAAEQGYDAQDKRDPFVPLVREGRFVSSVAGGVGDFSNPALAGILWDPGGNSIALINEMEVKVGDVLGEYEVTEIRPDAVVLMRQGKPLVLQMSFDSAPVKEQKDKGR